MKNRIYEAFDGIKLDDDIKRRVYQSTKVDNKKRISKYIYSTIGLIFTVCLIFYIIPKDESVPKGNGIEILSSTNDAPNTILYDGNIYVMNTELDINDITIGDKLGTLNQAEVYNDLAASDDASYSDDYEIYASSIKDVLIVKYKDDLIMYKIQ